MNAVKIFSRLRSQTRAFNTSAMRKRSFEEFKELQRQMQLDETVPVYLRKGTPDKLLFSTVIMGLLVCTGMAAEFLYSTIWPKK